MPSLGKWGRPSALPLLQCIQQRARPDRATTKKLPWWPPLRPSLRETHDAEFDVPCTFLSHDEQAGVETRRPEWPRAEPELRIRPEKNLECRAASYHIRCARIKTIPPNRMFNRAGLQSAAGTNGLRLSVSRQRR